MAALLLTQGLLLDCDGSRINVCPDRIGDPEFVGVIARYLAGKPTPSLQGHYQTVDDTPGCPSRDACAVYGLPETEIARLAVWIRIDALVSTLRPHTSAREGTPEVFLPTVDEADARLREIGSRAACNPALDGGHVLTRSDIVLRLVSWLHASNPEPCPPPLQLTR